MSVHIFDMVLDVLNEKKLDYNSAIYPFHIKFKIGKMQYKLDYISPHLRYDLDKEFTIYDSRLDFLESFSTKEELSDILDFLLVIKSDSIRSYMTPDFSSETPSDAILYRIVTGLPDHLAVRHELPYFGLRKTK